MKNGKIVKEPINSTSYFQQVTERVKDFFSSKIKKAEINIKCLGFLILVVFAFTIEMITIFLYVKVCIFFRAHLMFRFALIYKLVVIKSTDWWRNFGHAGYFLMLKIANQLLLCKT